MTDRRRPPDDFEMYVTGAADHLLRLAYLLEGRVGDAEDLVQDTLLRAMRAWPRVQAAKDVDRYVSRILINLHRNRLRRLRSMVSLDGADPAGEAAGSVEDRWDLARALQSLPLGQRQVIVLRYFEGESEERTAEILGCSVGSVKRQAARARDKLRDHPALRDDNERHMEGSA